MGLLDEQNQPTPKVEDIQTFLEHHGVDVLALIEPELHGPTPEYSRETLCLNKT